VPAALRVERADTHEPVHPALGGEEAEGVLARDAVGGALYAGLLTERVLDGL
jgi:hypothetical protein